MTSKDSFLLGLQTHDQISCGRGHVHGTSEGWYNHRLDLASTAITASRFIVQTENTPTLSFLFSVFHHTKPHLPTSYRTYTFFSMVRIAVAAPLAGLLLLEAFCAAYPFPVHDSTDQKIISTLSTAQTAAANSETPPKVVGIGLDLSLTYG